MTASGSSASRWWLAHRASDAEVAAFLQRLGHLSKQEWLSIKVRSKETKVYASATNEIDHLNSIYPERRSVWAATRANAFDIARRNAPWGLHSPSQLGDAAADAVGALVQLYPWGHGFERLYGPFSDVIPLESLSPMASSEARNEASPPDSSADGLVESGASHPEAAAQQRVGYGRAVGFFSGEMFAILLWLLVGGALAAQGGSAGWIVGGLPAIATFFALKVSRGPIASIRIIRYERRLRHLRSTDKTTYDFVMQWRGRTTTIGAVVTIVELILVLGYCATHRS